MLNRTLWGNKEKEGVWERGLVSSGSSAKGYGGKV